MSIIRDYIKSQLIEPMKMYPTTIQDTLLSIIADRLESLYEYTKRFPEIIKPDASRLDILQTIIKQFQFTIRDEADIYEQLDILENILHVYNMRGSIDTIENMWKYYGGDLPKDVKVNIPSYNLFRYSISRFSKSHVFPDENTYRSGVYEIILNNSTYPIDKLKEFMLKELVAAGNRIYFTNSLYSILTSEQESSYRYDVLEDTHIHTNLSTITYRSGLTFSGFGGLSRSGESSIWSGRPDLLLEIVYLYDLGNVLLNYSLFDGIEVLPQKTDLVHYAILYRASESYIQRQMETSYTPPSNNYHLERYFYNAEGEILSSEYPGYFILANTLLGSEVL